METRDDSPRAGWPLRVVSTNDKPTSAAGARASLSLLIVGTDAPKIDELEAGLSGQSLFHCKITKMATIAETVTAILKTDVSGVVLSIGDDTLDAILRIRSAAKSMPVIVVTDKATRDAAAHLAGQGIVEVSNRADLDESAYEWLLLIVWQHQRASRQKKEPGH